MSHEDVLKARGEVLRACDTLAERVWVKDQTNWLDHGSGRPGDSVDPVKFKADLLARLELRRGLR